MTEAGVYLSGALTAFVALILLGAAWHKAQSFLETTGFVAGYGLVPPGREAVVLRLLIASEAGAVALLVMPWTRVAGGALAAALFAGYGVAMGLALRAGKDRIECGCGGAPQIVSRPVILRNLILAAAAVLLPEGPMGPAAAAVALAAGITLWCVYGIVERLLANAGHMRLAARS